MTTRIAALSLATAAFTACGAGAGGNRVPLSFPVPQGAENPIVLEYSGASVADLTNLVAQVCSDVPIPTAQVRSRDGFVETRWVDIASFTRGYQAEALPSVERNAIYVFQIRGAEGSSGVIQIAGYYQPSRPPGSSPQRNSRYDRLLPTDHPGYQIALELDFRLKRALTENGIEYVSDETEGGY